MIRMLTVCAPCPNESAVGIVTFLAAISVYPVSTEVDGSSKPTDEQNVL